MPNGTSRSAIVVRNAQILCNRPRRVVRDRRRTRAAARADKCEHFADRRRRRAVIERCDRFDHLQRIERRNEIFVHALADHLAIEPDVVRTADDDDFRPRIAHMGKLLELAQDRTARSRASRP